MIMEFIGTTPMYPSYPANSVLARLARARVKALATAAINAFEDGELPRTNRDGYKLVTLS